ncbi:MAG: glycosyl transferase family protein [Phyllobacterium sp.]
MSKTGKTQENQPFCGLIRAAARPATSETPLPSTHLGRLRLLVALDTLLVEGSVSTAAERLELSVPAMSRLLGQIREAYNDPILVRAGRRLVPTPRAEALRNRLRALAAEAEALMNPTFAVPYQADEGPASDWNVPALIKAAPLAMRSGILLDGQPSPEQTAEGLAKMGADADPRRRLAKHIAVIGRGIGNSRPLTMEEAEDAFSIVLKGDADPMQIAALLQLMHYRGETAPELAGFTKAAHNAVDARPITGAEADLDWPAYLSPKSPRAPWFLQAAKLVSMVGHRVVLHGSNGDGENGGKLDFAAKSLDIPVCSSIDQASVALNTKGIAYLPLAGFAPQLAALLATYSLFLSRSPVSDVVHLLNPLGASASLLGVSRPAYRELHRDAARLLAWPSLSVLNSSRDVAEYAPFRSATVHRLHGMESHDLMLRPVAEPETLPRVGLSSRQYWKSVWNGTAIDERAEEVVTSTAALALLTVNGHGHNSYEHWREVARRLWSKRLHHR